MRSKQRGYMKLDGVGSAIVFIGCVIFVVGVAVGGALFTGVPVLWGMLKPWLHSITG